MHSAMWQGDSLFLLRQLVLKDFRIRYRNMSLGVFWSVLQPLVMVTLLTYVFKIVFQNTIPHYPVLVLTGLIPYNFFALSWISSTESLVHNVGLVKRVPVERSLVPVASVLANLMHLGIQFLLLLCFILYDGLPITWQWLWLLLLWGLEVMFLVGLGLMSSAINVFVRDMRYVVESTNLVLFWLVPISYTFDMVPPTYRELYLLNPISALVMASRFVLLEAKAPPPSILWKMSLISVVMLAVGWFVFRKLSRRFYAYL